MGFRDYSPGLNRFLTRDMCNGALADLQLGTDPWNTNRYASAGGNPITGIELDVSNLVGDCDSEWEAITTVAGRLGMSAETLRKWVRQAGIDAGRAPGVATESAREIWELKRKNAELPQTIEILKAATSFFVRESEPQRR